MKPSTLTMRPRAVLSFLRSTVVTSPCRPCSRTTRLFSAIIRSRSECMPSTGPAHRDSPPSDAMVMVMSDACRQSEGNRLILKLASSLGSAVMLPIRRASRFSSSLARGLDDVSVCCRTGS
ncbi:hypothetical protein INR49_002777 [Caranx melampygus]|nr:hypothetical protein INR49_002822 [Caranx melampygus]KAG7235320.1 hypothetical protein INR49_002777 [Caranx melampygus]